MHLEIEGSMKWHPASMTSSLVALVGVAAAILLSCASAASDHPDPVLDPSPRPPKSAAGPGVPTGRVPDSVATGTEAVMPTSITDNPDAYVFTIGINYDKGNKQDQLLHCQSDARRIANQFEKRCGVPPERQEMATGASKQYVLQQLKKLVDKAATGSLLVFYYSGHGVEVNGQTWLTTADTQLGDENSLRDTTIRLCDLYAVFAASRIDKFVFIVDACRTKINLGSSATSEPCEMTWDVFAKKLKDGGSGNRQVGVLLACEAGQPAWTDASSRTGLLTEAICDGLAGAAAEVPQTTDTERFGSAVHVGGLFDYAAQKTTQLAASSSKIQRPVRYSAELGHVRLLGRSKLDESSKNKLFWTRAQSICDQRPNRGNDLLGAEFKHLRRFHRVATPQMGLLQWPGSVEYLEFGRYRVTSALHYVCILGVAESDSEARNRIEQFISDVGLALGWDRGAIDSDRGSKSSESLVTQLVGLSGARIVFFSQKYVRSSKTDEVFCEFDSGCRDATPGQRNKQKDVKEKALDKKYVYGFDIMLKER